jgi:hypothetical protein
MTLLDQYLKSVSAYLPGGPQREDIIAELAEHLRSKMEDREAVLGRSLTELEQEAVLAEHGDPMVVAGRYGSAGKGLAFGAQLIGPGLFPFYLRALALVFGLTIAIVPAIWLFAEAPPLRHPLRIVFPMLVQFVVVTAIFAGIDLLRRRSLGDISGRSGRDNWQFPPAYLRPIPRWQSTSGLVCLMAVGVWWIAVPYAPTLILGRSAGELELSPSWQRFNWPVLTLLSAGIIQRAVNLARPDLNWLQPAMRLVINAACLGLLYAILRAFPFVIASPSAQAGADAAAMARSFDNWLWWHMLAGLGTYWLVNVLFYVRLATEHARYVIRSSRERMP